MFRSMIEDARRNDLIEQDVLAALSRGRRCLILSQWKDHCLLLAQGLRNKGKTPFVLNGGMGKKERTAILNAIQDTPRDKDLIVVATGQYLGEGFDCPQLDALFLAFPNKFKGKLVQYTGRVLREFPGKTDAEVYDYVDVRVPVLKHMYARRSATYKALGVETAQQMRLSSAMSVRGGLHPECQREDSVERLGASAPEFAREELL
jgi:superfamily II DNA or RNA helicase